MDSALSLIPTISKAEMGSSGWLGSSISVEPNELEAVDLMLDHLPPEQIRARPVACCFYCLKQRRAAIKRDEPDLETYARCSPITDAADLTRPLLLIHGMADYKVVIAHTPRMSAALLAAGRPHRVLLLSGSTHMPTDENTVSQFLRQELDFLTEALGLTAAVV